MLNVRDEGDYIRIELTEPRDAESLDRGIAEIERLLIQKDAFDILTIYPDEANDLYAEYWARFAAIPNITGLMRKVYCTVVVSDSEQIRFDAKNSVVYMPHLVAETYRKADLDAALAFVDNS